MRRLLALLEPGDYFLTIDRDGMHYEWVVTEDGDIDEVQKGSHFDG